MEENGWLQRQEQIRNLLHNGLEQRVMEEEPDT